MRPAVENDKARSALGRAMAGGWGYGAAGPAVMAASRTGGDGAAGAGAGAAVMTGRPACVCEQCVGSGESSPVLVSEGGLGPRSWWYIPKRGIYHKCKLTQPRARRAGISPARGGGSATRLRIPGV